MSVQIYFGVPGSGKTTYAAKIAYRNIKKGVKTYSNVPILGTYLFDVSDIGRYDFSDADMIIDEASIEYNNRAYKTMSKDAIKWFKLYRHYGIRNIYIFSQSYDDMDITLRRLSDVMYLVKRSLIPACFRIRRIGVKISIDKETHQIADTYHWQGIIPRYFCGSRYWYMFNSWSAPELPEREEDKVIVSQSPKQIRRIIRNGKREKFLSIFRRKK